MGQTIVNFDSVGDVTSPADRLTVLVCEPSGVQRQILGKRLEEAGFEVTGAQSGSQAMALINAGLCDILITGVELSDFSGFELCWRIKSDPSLAHIHTIVLSANGDLDRLTEALDSGADDFLRKPLIPAEFRARLRAASRIVRLQRRLLDEASNDVLTGVMNRRSIMRALDRALAQAREHARPVHLAMIDLDRFKAVNDTYGHAAGDAVLVHVARTARAFLTGEECFGRLGGEEFVLILPGLKRREAYHRCDALRARLEAAPVAIPDFDPIWITASLGLAGADGEPAGYDASLLFKEADAALYRAKETGRNQVCAA